MTRAQPRPVLLQILIQIHPTRCDTLYLLHEHRRALDAVAALLAEGEVTGLEIEATVAGAKR